MKNMLRYRRYYGTMEYSSEDECFSGRVFGINDLILFEGDSVKALKANLHEAVNSYLGSCEERGEEPDKFYRDSFNTRATSELHKKATLTAKQRHQTLNSFVESAICMMVSTIL